MCEDMTGHVRPYHTARAERLKELCRLMGLDAILLITGWDGSYNLGSKSLVEWLCESPGAQPADYEDALEEGLFVITPDDVEWCVAHDTDCSQVLTEHEQAANAAATAPSPVRCRSCSRASDPMQLSPAHSFEQDSAIDQGIQQIQQQQQHQACCGHSAAATANAHSIAGHSYAAASVHAAVLHQAVPMQPAGQIDGKLSLLLQLHPRLRRVGVSLGTEVLSGQLHAVHADTILKWPLLMALAETIGVSMEALFQDIVDISHQLPQFLSVVDGTMLFNILRNRRPQLHRAWLEAMSGCWRRSSGPKLDLSELAMAAPLIEYISGCRCRLSLGLYQPLSLPPRVLFGPRTSDTGALSSDHITLRTISGQQGYAVLHATAEAADACCGLRFARTVFFSQGAADRTTQPVAQQPAVTAAPKAQEASQQASQLSPAQTSVDYDVDQQDLFDLLTWYEAAVKAAWEGMRHFATQANASWASMQRCITATFSAVISSAGLPQPLSALESQGHPCQQQQQQQPILTLQLFSWDGGPRPTPVLHGVEQYNMRLKTLRVMCSGIRSRSAAHPGALLGSVLYSDTFIEVPATGGSPAQLVNLTITHCPLYTFNFWGSEAAENAQLVASFRRHLQLQLQAQLTAQAQAQLQAHIQAQMEAQARRKSVDNPLGVSQQQQQSAVGVAGGEMTGSPPSPAAKEGPAATAQAAVRSSPQPPQQQLLLLQQHLQQQQQALAAKKGLRRLSTPEQQQLLLLQQQQQALQAQALMRQHALPLPPPNNRQQQLHGHSGQHTQLAANDGSSNHSPLVEGGNGNIANASSKASKHSCCGPSSSIATAAGGDAGQAISVNTAALHAPAVSASKRSLIHPGSPLVQRSPTPPLLTGPHVISNGFNKSQSPEAAAVAAAHGFGGGASPAFLLQRLGQLLVPPGEMPGEIGLVFTGADKLAVMDGPLYPHQGGLAFISRPSKVHVLLLEQVESVWLQELGARLPGYAAVGPCVVIKGKRPACGLLPAAHLTDNPHVLIPLRAMSKVCREHWVTAVLPAWQSAAGIVTNSQGAAAAWPVPVELQPAYRYWLQGARKRYMVVQPDEVMEALLLAMDKPHQQQDSDMQDASAVAAQL